MSVPFNELRVIPTPTQSAVGQIDFAARNDAFAVSLASPDSLAANVTFRLPPADGTAGQFIQTDGSQNLSFAGAGGASGIFKLMSSGLSINNSTTLVDLPGMTYTLAVGTAYRFRYVIVALLIDTGALGGIKMHINFTGNLGTGGTFSFPWWAIWKYGISGFGTTPIAVSPLFSGSNSQQIAIAPASGFYYANITVEGWVVIDTAANGASSGTFSVQVAQQTAVAGNTIMFGANNASSEMWPML